MKKLLFILLLTLPFFGFGQERYHVDEVTSPNDTLTYSKFDMSLVNGLVYSDLGELGHYNKGKKMDFGKNQVTDQMRKDGVIQITKME